MVPRAVTDERMRRDLQRQADMELGRRIIPGSFIYLIAMAVLVAVTSVRHQWPAFTVFFIIANLVLCSTRLLWGMSRQNIYARSPALWKTIGFILILSMAGLWGFSSAAAFFIYGITQDTFILIVALASISLGAFSTLSTHLWLLWAFQILAMIPTAVACLFMGTPYAYSLCIFIITAHIFMFIQGRAYFNVYWDSITDNTLLTAKQKELEVAKETVEAARHGLEIKVNERTFMLQESARQLDESYSHTIEALITALDSREHDTGNHSLRVAYYTSKITEAAGMSGRELEEVALGALLHDIGKIGISDIILTKPAELTAGEWVQMKRHPQIGWEMIKDIEFIGNGRELVLSHQERFNGSGYPRGLKGKEIYEGARFFAIIDTFDALTSDRPYRKAVSFKEGIDVIRAQEGGLFDPEVVKVFLSITMSEWLGLHETASKSSFHSLIKKIRRAPTIML
jgi:HD-GYP domain-containing protein (c-di-GMP phosphodiesterase class II)